MQLFNRLPKNNKEAKHKGFTLIELLVVVAILGTLAAIAIPSVGKFINNGKDKAYATELHDVQTAVMAMMTEADSGLVDAVDGTATSTAWSTPATGDLSLVTSVQGAANLKLSDYMVGLDGTTAATKCLYQFKSDGSVQQTTP